MAQMDAIHFCRFKSNSPGKLVDTVIILFVHESFINVASDSLPGSDDALPAQDEEGVCFIAASTPSLQRGRCLLAY